MRHFMTTVSVLAGIAAALAADIHRFNGDLSCGKALEVPEAKQVTFAAWVKIDGWGKGDKPYPRIVQAPAFYLHPTIPADGSGLAGVTFGVNMPGKPSAWSFHGLLPTNAWAHVAVTMGAASEYDPGTPKLWINGTPAEVGMKGKPLPAVYKGGTAYLGNASKGGNRPFEGEIVDVRITYAEDGMLYGEEV